MAWHKAVWTNGKRTVTGRWIYLPGRGAFLIELDSLDRITGRQRQIELLGNDTPEWGRWKLIRS